MSKVQVKGFEVGVKILGISVGRRVFYQNYTSKKHYLEAHGT